jgi:nucleoside transporter
MNAGIRIKLSFMMFLEFFVWGAWFVTLGTFLFGTYNASGTQVGTAFLTQSFGAIIAPFIVGIIADKYFAAQRIFGVLHIIGGVLLWMAGQAATFDAFFPLILVYMILFMPTLALANSIAFRQMTNTEKEFPPIRILGTAGWIIAGLLISYLAWDSQDSGQLGNTFVMASIASVILGVFAFTLPNTPPAKKGEKVSIGELLGLDAIRLLNNRSYLIFFLSSIAICIPLAFYYNFTNAFLTEVGVAAPTAIQSLGQVSEFLFLLVMPFLFARYGVKTMLAIGMFAWVLRYLFFAYGDADAGYWMLIGGVVLHGICYDFFFVTGQIYTDNLAGERFKSSAQGLITLATYGVGMLIGSLISGPIVDNYLNADGSHNWEGIWVIPAAIAGVVVVLFLLFFKDRNRKQVVMENEFITEK